MLGPGTYVYFKINIITGASFLAFIYACSKVITENSVIKLCFSNPFWNNKLLPWKYSGPILYLGERE